MTISKLALVAIVVAAIVSPISAWSQSYLFEDGQNGVVLAATIGSGEDYAMLGGTFGFTVAGRFDLGLGCQLRMTNKNTVKIPVPPNSPHMLVQRSFAQQLTRRLAL